MRMKVALQCAVALGMIGTPLAAQPVPGPSPAPAPSREDALDPSPVDPSRDPDIGLFLNDWRNSKPRVEFGKLVFRDILTRLDSADPIRPSTRGAVLSAITAVSQASLAPGASAIGRMRSGEREIFYTTGGTGQLVVNGQSHALRDGIGFVLTPDFDFRLVNSGKTAMTFYVRTEPLPAGTPAATDVAVYDRWQNDRRVGAHWMHICNGGPSGMNYCTIAPYTMPQPHSHAIEEVWLLVKGESILTLGKNLVRMSPGQAYRIPPTGMDAHSNLNLGDEPLELIYMGPAVRGPGPNPNADFARLDNSPIAPRTAPDVDMYMGHWRDAYPRIVHGNLYMRDMLTALQGDDELKPTRKGAVLVNADSVSHAMLEPGSSAHRIAGELKGLQQSFVVASGTGRISAGGKSFDLVAGMSFVIGPETDFRLTATGEAYLTFYVVTEKLAADSSPSAELRVVDSRSAPTSLRNWHNRERPLLTKADGLSRFTAVTHVEQKAMSMARPYSAAPGTEEIWIALDDVDMLFGKQLRKLPAGTAYKVPATGITAHAKINLTGKPARFISLIK